MTNQNLTHITMILDRSGSMEDIKSDVIGAVNGFIKSQKEQPGECTFTLVQFDGQDPYEVICDGLKIQDAKDLTLKTYVPRGSTPLLDAIGSGIVDLGAKLAAKPEQERPSKVVFVIQTDGLENASREYTNERIKQMITEQTEKWNWNFVFLGANQDAIAAGGAIGIDSSSSMSYAGTGAGYKNMMCSNIAAINRLRSGEDKTVSFTDKEREVSMSS